MKFEKILIIICFFISSSLIAQDGSNIRYYEPDVIDNSFVGKQCHVDFGEISFRSRTVDTIEINVNGNLIRFYEHRVDDGYNNWFNEQYLVNADHKIKQIKLQNSRIDSITKHRIYLTSTLSYYINESPLDTITIFQHWYNKKDIAKVLIKD